MNTVATFDAEQALTVTPEAAAHLKRQLARHASAVGVHLAVKDSGCSGYKYVLEPVESEPEASSALAVDDELTLYVDRKSLPFLTGSTLRFVREGLNEQIQFENPRAGDYCGCGESFSVAPEA